MEKYFDLLFKDSFDMFIDKIKNNLLKEKKMFILTANPETFMFSESEYYIKDQISYAVKKIIYNKNR